MSFSQELKDFTASFQAGYKMVPSQTDEEYKRAQTEYQKALTHRVSASNPALDDALKSARIDSEKAHAEYYRGGGGGGGRGRSPAEDKYDWRSGLSPETMDDLNNGANTYADELEQDFAHGGQVAAIPDGQLDPNSGMQMRRQSRGEVPQGPWNPLRGNVPQLDPNSGMTQRAQSRGEVPQGAWNPLWGNTPQVNSPFGPLDSNSGMTQRRQARAELPQGPWNPLWGNTPQAQNPYANPYGRARPKAPTLGGKMQGIPSYAAGGVVDDEEAEGPAPEATENEAPSSVHALPLSTMQAIPENRMSDSPGKTSPDYAEPMVEDPNRPTPQGLGFSFAASTDAAKAGLEDVATRFGLNGAVPDPNKQQRGREAMENGIEAVDPKQLQEVDKAIGPAVSRLTEDQRNMARLAYVYEFFMKNGEQKRARNAAGDLVQTYRMISNRYGAIAKAAGAEGDIDGAVDAAARAYAYIPDGKDLKIQKNEKGGYVFTYVDSSTGKVIEKGVKSPEEVLQIVTKHGLNNFDELVMASGNKDEIGAMNTRKAAEAKAAPKPLSMKDRAAASKDIDGAWDEQFTDENGTVNAGATQKLAGPLKSAASGIYAGNEVSASDALEASMAILAVDPMNPGKTAFKMVGKPNDDKSKGEAIEIGGRRFMVPPDQFKRLMQIRQKRVDAADNDIAAVKARNAHIRQTNKDAGSFVKAAGDYALGDEKNGGKKSDEPVKTEVQGWWDKFSEDLGSE